jgi:hypothetical protein
VAVADGGERWHLLPESSLGPPETVGGERARVLKSTGSVFHKAEWIVDVPPDSAVERVHVRSHYSGEDIVDLIVFAPDRTVYVAGELGSAPGWRDSTFEAASGAAQQVGPQQQVDYGTGIVRIESVVFLDALGRDVVQARHGEPMTVRITVRVDRTLADRRVAIVVGFRRQGSAYNGSVYEAERLLPASDVSVIDMKLDPMRFGSGQWFVSVGIGKPGVYERPVVNYFATDPDWYHLLAGGVQLQILSAGGVDAVGCFVVHPATVTCTPVEQGAAVR